MHAAMMSWTSRSGSLILTKHHHSASLSSKACRKSSFFSRSRPASCITAKSDVVGGASSSATLPTIIRAATCSNDPTGLTSNHYDVGYGRSRRRMGDIFHRVNNRACLVGGMDSTIAIATELDQNQIPSLVAASATGSNNFGAVHHQRSSNNNRWDARGGGTNSTRRQFTLLNATTLMMDVRPLPLLLHQQCWFLCNKNRSVGTRLYSQSSRRRQRMNQEKNSNSLSSSSSSNNNSDARINDSITSSDNNTSSKSNNLHQATSLQETDASLQEESSNSSTKKQQANSKPSEPSIHNISYLPSSLHPYAHLARLDKPIGTFLLLHPCLWSTALAATPLGSTPDLSLCALFTLGSFIMRGAGCTINDMWDSKYDRNVERTKSRPLASGALSYKHAWAFLALQLSAGLGVLVSLPNVEQCFVWGVAALPLVATYPLMKRYTNYPQLALGLTFNWGAIMGWVAVHGDVDWSVVGSLYGSGVAWTLVYDTLYAHQDKKDDAKLGLKSTALTFGEDRTKPILTGLAGLTWCGWMMAGYNCGFGEVLDAPYYYVGVSAAASHLLWQIYTADLNHAENLAYRFRSNNLVGWMVLGSCVAGNVMAG